MRRVLASGFAIVAGLTLSACGGASPAQRAVPVMPQPLIANTPSIPTVAVGWTPVQTAQVEAAQLGVAETRYATCYAYAGLDQGLAQDVTPTTMGPSQSCATYGLSSAEVRQIQDLLTQTA